MDNDSHTCTALMGDLSFCGRTSVPLTPFPICRRHLLQAHQFVQGLMQESFARMDEGAEDRVEEARRRLRIGRDAHSVVYYVLEPDGMVKIGYTNNMKDRLIALRIGFDAVLAMEPGGRTLERERHLQFKHLRRGRWEKFRPATDLQDHIAAVVEQHGPPRIADRVEIVDVER